MSPRAARPGGSQVPAASNSPAFSMVASGRPPLREHEARAPSAHVASPYTLRCRSSDSSSSARDRSSSPPSWQTSPSACSDSSVSGASGPTSRRRSSRASSKACARRAVLPARLVDETEDVLQPRPHRRHVPQERQGARLRAPEELSDGHLVAVRPHRRIRGLEQVEEDASHLLGRVALQLRHTPLLAPARAPARPRPRRKSARLATNTTRGEDGQPVAPRELTEAVTHGVRLREHGSPVQESTDLLAELPGRHVPAIRLLAQGRQDDPIEVAPDTARQPPPVESREPSLRAARHRSGRLSAARAPAPANGFARRRHRRRHALASSRVVARPFGEWDERRPPARRARLPAHTRRWRS